MPSANNARKASDCTKVRPNRTGSRSVLDLASASLTGRLPRKPAPRAGGRRLRESTLRERRGARLANRFLRLSRRASAGKRRAALQRLEGVQQGGVKLSG